MQTHAPFRPSFMNNTLLNSIKFTFTVVLRCLLNEIMNFGFNVKNFERQNLAILLLDYCKLKSLFLKFIFVRLNFHLISKTSLY